jgi:hypothetical protein
MTATLTAITFDCTDAAALAAFWSDVLAAPVAADATAAFATITPGDGGGAAPAWFFVRVPEGKRTKNRVHVDLTAAHLDAEVARVVALGATKIADFDQDDDRWTTLADPEGNEFDIVAG